MYCILKNLTGIFKFRIHTRLVLVLYVIAGDDAVSIEPLDPAQIHAPVLHLPHFQFRWIWWFCVCVCVRERYRRWELFTNKLIWLRADSTFCQWTVDITSCTVLRGLMLQRTKEVCEVCAVCAGDTLHSELDEPSTLSIGVDGMAGEEDRIPSLGWVQLWASTQTGKRLKCATKYKYRKCTTNSSSNSFGVRAFCWVQGLLGDVFCVWP